MTVGPGITPGLLTLHRREVAASARGLDALRAITAGGESHPALRTLPTAISVGVQFVTQISGVRLEPF
jgi:hypothetical protein